MVIGGDLPSPANSCVPSASVTTQAAPMQRGHGRVQALSQHAIQGAVAVGGKLEGFCSSIHGDCL